MKKTLLLLLCLAIPFCASAPTVDPAVHQQQAAQPKPKPNPVQQVTRLVRAVNPMVSTSRVVRIVEAVATEARRRGINPLILAGILAQESTFRPGLETCYFIERDDELLTRCDLGLGQVNWETWGEELGLDRDRLQWDDRYNIRVAAAILGRLKQQYGAERTWWTRYHHSRPGLRQKYHNLVQKQVGLVALRL